MEYTKPFLELVLFSPEISFLVFTLVCTVYAMFPNRKSAIFHLPLPTGAETIWGHEKMVFTKEPGQTFRKWIGQFGMTFRIKAAFGAPDILVLSDPLAVTHILQKKIYDYHHSSTVRPRVARLLGKGLGWVEGETEHKRMKRLMMPALTAENVKAMSTDVIDSVELVISKLNDVVQRSGNATEVNILDWTGKATLNVIGRIAFLHDFEAGDSKDAQDILNARKSAVPSVTQYIGFLTLMLLRRFPILNSLPIHAIQGQGLAKRTIQAGVARELIRRNLDTSANRYSKDLLSRLCKLKQKLIEKLYLTLDTVNAAAEDHITLSEVYEHISTFMIAGAETTAVLVAFAVWELSRHQDKQERLREELSSSARPTYRDFQDKFPFLDAIIKESLRLYPGLPYMERVATKDDVLPLSQAVPFRDGGSTTELPIKAGQTVIIPIVSIHRQDSVWGGPDDFHPERWLGTLPPQEQLTKGWSHLLAFSDGPRSCIGARLAIFEAKVILSSLVTNFRFASPGYEVSLKISSSLQPWVRVDDEDPGRNSLPVIITAI